MTQTPEEFKSPSKTSRQGQDHQLKLSKDDHPERGPYQSDDRLADACRHDSDTTTPTPVPPLDNLDEDSI